MNSAAHAELMDGTYRHQRHIYDLSRKYYLLGRDRMIDAMEMPRGADVLELGCGTGRNLAAVAKRWPNARLHGLDISAEMLASAGNTAQRSGLEMKLVQGDASSFDPEELFGKPAFDRVFISYALSMIPAWEETIDAAMAALSPQGSLHIVDFGQQERLPSLFRSALHAWLARFHVNPRATLFDVVEGKAEKAGLKARSERLYRGYTWHMIVSQA
ncbi:class I SAM-dependent methyltransferase [Hoeflea sp. WL0058]|uniref:Class I SAM-dependent methyltransferase n=1 Tax=Flavimaribacter sediminis TaxID=2865987 RepID=A0AAE2ZGG1_9HYPH|nr:class I SAM-dependent methyltransferase [Flavimaribacter sediminis]MBW8635741.1 class I SAM-dependent methyltransferase [Flavimaribacter sediminis]